MSTKSLFYRVILPISQANRDNAHAECAAGSADRAEPASSYVAIAERLNRDGVLTPCGQGK